MASPKASKIVTGFIGSGRMASALAIGAVESGALAAEQLCFLDRNQDKLEKLEAILPGCRTLTRLETLLEVCNHLVLAVKPAGVVEVAEEIKNQLDDKLLVSIVAGISLKQLTSMFASDCIARVMPNTPVQVRAGASAVSFSTQVTSEQRSWLKGLMESVGCCVEVPDEKMHAVTAVAGSSPAYIYQIIEAMSDGGVAEGLPRETALRLSAEAVVGAAAMILKTGEHPGVLKDQVCSPGGTTIVALAEMERCGVRSAMIRAVRECVARSRQLEANG